MAGSSLGGTPLEFSDVDGDLSPAVDGSLELRAGGGPWTCPTCTKVLKTRGGYRKHGLLHRLKDVTQSLHEKLQVMLHPTMIEVILRIVKEPAPDSDFEEIGAIMLENENSHKFSNFLLEISTVVIDILLERKNVLLSKFVEESECSVFNYLANNDHFDSLKHYFSELLSSSNTFEDGAINTFLFRICSLFFESIMAQTLRFLRSSEEGEDVSEEVPEEEISLLLGRSRSILQSLLRAGVSGASVKVLCSRFVDQPVTVRDFLDSKLWEIGVNENKIIFSEDAIKFFLKLECVIKKLLRDGGQTLPEDIWVCAGKPGSGASVLLDYISNLGRGLLSEDEAVDLFSDIFKCYSFMSCDLEAKDIKASYDAQGSLNVVALRTNLKRNPTKKSAEK